MSPTLSLIFPTGVASLTLVSSLFLSLLTAFSSFSLASRTLIYLSTLTALVPLALPTWISRSRALPWRWARFNRPTDIRGVVLMLPMNGRNGIFCPRDAFPSFGILVNGVYALVFATKLTLSFCVYNESNNSIHLSCILVVHQAHIAHLLLHILHQSILFHSGD